MERAELAALLAPYAAGGVATRVIAESDQRKFMQAFAASVAGTEELFLADPAWGSQEQTQVGELLKPKLLNQKSKIEEGWLMIPTGGTGGQVKFARHDSATLAAAVRGFSQHFSLSRVNAVGVLPLHHVSGLMAWLRCVLTGGEYWPGDWKAIEAGVFPALPAQPEDWVVSLVPTQLERLVRQPAAVEWLRNFRIIFVGGGPTRAELLQQGAALGLPLSLGYGMTETAAMVTALRPEQFLLGDRSTGRALPHATVRTEVDGTIVVGANSLFRGYWPDWRGEEEFVTNDVGHLDERNHLHVRGRRDAVIISGGEKVNPAEVEAVLCAEAGLTEVVVLGVPDADWGQRVVAAYPATVRLDEPRVQQALARLAVIKRPKAMLPLADWPVNAQGKVNRAEVARQVGALRKG